MLETFMGHAILPASSRRVVKLSPLFLSLLVLVLPLAAVPSNAEPRSASPRAALPRDGAIFVGSVPGDATSSGHLILERNFRQTRLLRWQSTDALLGRADSDFFQPRSWQIRDHPIEELTFMDRSPDPAMRGRVMLGAPNKALIEVVVGDDMSSYQLVRVDIGLRFVDGTRETRDAHVLARNPHAITPATFEAQRCHMRPLRVSGVGIAVLDDSNDGVVEVFDLEGRKLKLPARLESLPVVLLVSGTRSGTTGLRVDYTLADQSNLEQEIALQVTGEIAEGQACPAKPAAGTGK